MAAHFESVRFYVRFFQGLKGLQLLGFWGKGWTGFDEFLPQPLEELFRIKKHSNRKR